MPDNLPEPDGPTSADIDVVRQFTKRLGKRFVLGVLALAALGILIWLTLPESAKTKLAVPREGLLQVLAAAASLLIMASIFSAFLEGGGKGVLESLVRIMVAVMAEPSTKTEERIDKLETALDKLQLEPPLAPTEADRALLVEELRRDVRHGATRHILNDLKEQLAYRENLALIRATADQTLERLRDERARLARRGNLNLFVGLVTTIVGLALLLTYAREQSAFLSALAVAARRTPGDAAQVTPDLALYMVTFVPRLALVGLIELFAYFFLGLYKSSLVDVKFIQNEMTNVEQRVLAVMAAFNAGDRAATADILKLVASTDRNSDGFSSSVGKAGVNQDKLLDVIKELAGTIKR